MIAVAVAMPLNGRKLSVDMGRTMDASVLIGDSSPSEIRTMVAPFCLATWAALMMFFWYLAKSNTMNTDRRFMSRRHPLSF